MTKIRQANTKMNHLYGGVVFVGGVLILLLLLPSLLFTLLTEAPADTLKTLAMAVVLLVLGIIAVRWGYRSMRRGVAMK